MLHRVEERSGGLPARLPVLGRQFGGQRLDALNKLGSTVGHVLGALHEVAFSDRVVTFLGGRLAGVTQFGGVLSYLSSSSQHFLLGQVRLGKLLNGCTDSFVSVVVEVWVDYTRGSCRAVRI